MAKAYQPTAEDLAKAEARRLKREQAKNSPAQAKAEDERGRILPREWVDLSPQSASARGQTVRVMTWNLLAQTLVRRELFPTSDCLKASQREHMLYREIASHNADICCLQEVDRTEKLFPELEKAGYAWVYAAGPRKKHGCLIAFRKDAYECVRERVVTYDDEEVREDGGQQARRGSSFRTKNIGSLVALRRVGADGDGVIVATTHLFWHPAQAAVLLREVAKFRDEGPEPQRRWPAIIAGDFNFGPDDPAYALLMGEPLLPEQKQRLESSYVVHATIDPTVAADGAAPAEEDEEGAAEAGENDPDRIIVNARPAQPPDGLLSDAELEELFRRSGRVTSAYDAGQRQVPGIAESGLTFGSRVSVPPERRGAFEPVYTSYTHYWQAVLDYIFVLDAPGRDVSIVRLAKPHPKEAFGEGLPRKGVCGSDHISLAAELHWPPP
ncbi:Endonuclease/exonuclease/phosphatase [Trametes coccinea BRFM310]|uniref:Endonuclease/exonuclease/phosphatase n=1 Tax=Trametes coccinea (strain BRFM310) TaxID=1353009 RepID=A0A1Y2IUF0_TRAC3|nr:Endonuclease/exonuclease/phosphatase [Trametes coccinea BRFM310]